MNNVTRTVRYEGYPAVASLLVQTLREEGVEVEWTPPDESRVVDPVISTIVLSLVANGLYDAIKLGVKKFEDMRMPKAQAEIQGDSSDVD
jgi:hypothetical protein